MPCQILHTRMIRGLPHPTIRPAHCPHCGRDRRQKRSSESKFTINHQKFHPKIGAVVVAICSCATWCWCSQIGAVVLDGNPRAECWGLFIPIQGVGNIKPPCLHEHQVLSHPQDVILHKDVQKDLHLIGFCRSSVKRSTKQAVIFVDLC